ncbi:hypothetical protein DFJ74DRAFT_674624 [Hyaloraphidium curvatum]|nr:hypothetical protein DFJ74DRAFT_674624 [Hyaloraphidium curvatum]
MANVAVPLRRTDLEGIRKMYQVAIVCSAEWALCLTGGLDQVFDRPLPPLPSAALPEWTEVASRRSRPSANVEEDDVPLAKRRKTTPGDPAGGEGELGPGNAVGTTDTMREASRRADDHGRQRRQSDVDRAQGASSAPVASAGAANGSQSVRGSERSDSAQRASANTAIDRGRHHKHQAERLPRGPLRSLHYLASATYFLEHGFGARMVDKTTEKFLAHVLTDVGHGDDPTLVDLGRRLDGLCAVFKFRRRQDHLAKSASSLQQKSLDGDDSSLKAESEAMCQQVLFLKEEVAAAERKWRELDASGRTSPITGLDAFSDPIKAMVSARRFLATYASKADFDFSISV